MPVTLVLVDLVGYSATALQQEANPNAAFDLPRTVETFVLEALKTAGLKAESVHAWTGDGAVLQFPQPDDARRFAAAVFVRTEVHNAKAVRKEDERHFRIGVATGEIELDPNTNTLAGIPVITAARLQGAARAGEVVIDRATYDKLLPPTQHLCGPEELISGKREEAISARRIRLTPGGLLGGEASGDDCVEQVLRTEPTWLSPEVREEIVKSLPPPEERERLYRELQARGGLSFYQLLDPASTEATPQP